MPKAFEGVPERGRGPGIFQEGVSNGRRGASPRRVSAWPFFGQIAQDNLTRPRPGVPSDLPKKTKTH